MHNYGCSKAKNVQGEKTQAENTLEAGSSRADFLPAMPGTEASSPGMCALRALQRKRSRRN